MIFRLHRETYLVAAVSLWAWGHRPPRLPGCPCAVDWPFADAPCHLPPLPHAPLRMPLQLRSGLGSAGRRWQLCSLQGAAEWPGSQTGLHLSNTRTGETKFISQLRLLTLEKAKEFGKSEAPSDPLDTYQLGSKRPCSSMSSQGPFWLPLRVPGQLSRCVSACDTDSQGWVFLGRLHGGVMQAVTLKVSTPPCPTHGPWQS